MADKRYAIVFRGRTVADADPARVQANLAQLFRIDEARAAAMFSGKPVLVKKDLDAAKAKSYRAALLKAGAEVEVIASPPSTPVAAPAEPAPARSIAAESGPATPPVAPDLTIAEPGVTLVEHAPVPPADFDTTQFDLAEVGADLVDYVPPVPPDFDLNGLSLDPPGTQLTEPRKVSPANFDTSALSLVDND